MKQGKICTIFLLIGHIGMGMQGSVGTIHTTGLGQGETNNIEITMLLFETELFILLP